MRFNKTESTLVVRVLRNVILVLFLVIFISSIYNFRNRESKTDSALIAEATASVEFKGVYIRNEIPLAYSGVGSLDYNVSDGGKLGNGSVVAEVYDDGAQISRLRQIDELETQLAVLQKIQNPGTLESAQPAELSDDIEENYRSLIYCRDMNDLDELENVGETLLVEMSTYQIITNEVESFDQQITDINAKLDELRQQSVAPRETIKSDRSAYFASYCDGYESILSEDSLDTLTIAQIEGVTDNKLTEPSVVGKLIDGYCWYLAGVIDNRLKNYSVGDYVSIKPESSDEVYEAQIYDIRDEGDLSRSLVILSCTQFDYDLVQHRTENIELIKGTYRGYKVPREAIRFEDITEVTTGEDGRETESTANYKGVYILKGEKIEFKKIDVIYEGNDYVLSKIHDDDGSYLTLYDDILIEDVDKDEQ